MKSYFEQLLHKYTFGKELTNNEKDAFIEFLLSKTNDLMNEILELKNPVIES